MKRRKKIWIACAALAVVVAVCALALLYRPTQYRFLKESKLVDVMVFTGGSSDRVHYFYETSRSIRSVAADAKAELQPSDGWTIQTWGDSVDAMNPVLDEQIKFWFIDHAGMGRVQDIELERSATVLDRLRAWTFKLQHGRRYVE